MVTMKYNVLRTILFDARRVVSVPSGNCENKEFAMNAVANLADYGFVLDRSGIELLCTASKEDIEKWYYQMSAMLSELAGGTHEYHPFYPGFPQQVIEMDEAELLFDQFIHYLTVAIADITGDASIEYRPDGEDPANGILSLETHKPKVLQTIDMNDLRGIEEMASGIFKNILRAKGTPSAKDMRTVVNPYIAICSTWTKDAAVVENRNLLSYLYVRASAQDADTSWMHPLVVKDYLRIARMHAFMKKNHLAAIESFQDIEQKNANGKVKYPMITTLPRPLIRFMSDGLEALGKDKMEEDMARDTEAWKHVFRAMHVNALNGHEELKEVADKIRHNKRLNTFYARIENAVGSGDYQKALRLYASRPGEFIKNLNRMLHFKFEDKESESAFALALIEKSREVFAKTRPEDLIRLITYLRARTREDMIPVHNVKGMLVCTEQKYSTLPVGAAELFAGIAKESIASQIKTGKTYGKVYIDGELANMPLPVESAGSDAMVALPRGARLPLERDEDGKLKNIRLFVWWTNTESGSRVDLDLSANLFGNSDLPGKTSALGSVSYWDSYKYGRDVCVHSGDITNGGSPDGDGAVEFIDISLEAVREKTPEIKYIQVYVNSFTGQPFGKVPHLAGWQVRKEMNKSQKFNIKAVQQTNTFDPASCGVTMAVIDISAGEIIWTDATDRRAVAATNSSKAANEFDLIMERYARGDQMTMKEMAELAASANGGEIVETMEEADVIFSVMPVENAAESQRVITAKDQDIWIGEFMSPQTCKEEPEAAEKEGTDEKTGSGDADHAEIGKDGIKETITSSIAETIAAQAVEEPAEEEQETCMEEEEECL